jgi:hypothetical protein
MGFRTDDASMKIYECPFCSKPTIFADGRQLPGAAFGADVAAVPNDIDSLYREARQCMSVSGYTSAVMDCRKLLMNIAVDKGAPANQNFIDYINYFETKGYIPPGSKGWVDHIRTKGNEANHEIKLMTQAEAEELISFVEMLLRFIYEYPAKHP